MKKYANHFFRIAVTRVNNSKIAVDWRQATGVALGF